VNQARIACLAEVEPPNIRDGDSIGISAQHLYLRSDTHLAWLDQGEVEPASPAHQEALDHVFTVKSDIQFVTGHARLSNHQDGRADPQIITDAKRVFL
jgi:hypothetical protein